MTDVLQQMLWHKNYFAHFHGLSGALTTSYLAMLFVLSSIHSIQASGLFHIVLCLQHICLHQDPRKQPHFGTATSKSGPWPNLGLPITFERRCFEQSLNLYSIISAIPSAHCYSLCSHSHNWHASFMLSSHLVTTRLELLWCGETSVNPVWHTGKVTL